MWGTAEAIQGTEASRDAHPNMDTSAQELTSATNGLKSQLRPI